MAIWPVFLWRSMHEDMGRPFAIGAVVAWDVVLVDGAAEGWPGDVLVKTDVIIEERPRFARHGSLARTPQLSACWRGDEPVGSRFHVRAGLLADLFNPPFLSTVTGVVQRIRIVSRRMTPGQRGVWSPSGEWQLADVRESPRWLETTGRDPAVGQEIGFLVALDVRSEETRPFPERPTNTTPASLAGQTFAAVTIDTSTLLGGRRPEVFAQPSRTDAQPGGGLGNPSRVSRLLRMGPEASAAPVSWLPTTDT